MYVFILRRYPLPRFFIARRFSAVQQSGFGKQGGTGTYAQNVFAFRRKRFQFSNKIFVTDQASRAYAAGNDEDIFSVYRIRFFRFDFILYRTRYSPSRSGIIPYIAARLRLCKYFRRSERIERRKIVEQDNIDPLQIFLLIRHLLITSFDY